MQLYANRLDDPATGLPPRHHFDSFFYSFLTVFQVRAAPAAPAQRRADARPGWRR